jgi:hypothetical protein
MILFKSFFMQLCKLKKSLIYLFCFLSVLYIFSKSKTLFCFSLGFFIASSISYINIYILSKSVCYILDAQVKKTKHFFFIFFSFFLLIIFIFCIALIYQKLIIGMLIGFVYPILFLSINYAY